MIRFPVPTSTTTTVEPKQLDLFADKVIQPSSLPPRPPQLVISQDVLIEWKSRIYNHQLQVREEGAPQQGMLFDLQPAHCDPAGINPFRLPPVAMSFYRLPDSDAGHPCIYFIIDAMSELLLYVGETGQSHRRWKGTHDCKDYIKQYIVLHRKYGLAVGINAAFWWDTPHSRKARQALELALIEKWKTPFNKENWQMWGQPFKS